MLIREGQRLKLSTKVAVFKIENLLIGGAKHVDWGTRPPLAPALKSTLLIVDRSLLASIVANRQSRNYRVTCARGQKGILHPCFHSEFCTSYKNDSEIWCFIRVANESRFGKEQRRRKIY